MLLSLLLFIPKHVFFAVFFLFSFFVVNGILLVRVDDGAGADGRSVLVLLFQILLLGLHLRCHLDKESLVRDVLVLVEVEHLAQDNVQSGDVVVVAARVAVSGFLVVP